MAYVYAGGARFPILRHCGRLPLVVSQGYAQSGRLFEEKAGVFPRPATKFFRRHEHERAARNDLDEWLDFALERVDAHPERVGGLRARVEDALYLGDRTESPTGCHQPLLAGLRSQNNQLRCILPTLYGASSFLWSRRSGVRVPSLTSQEALQNLNFG